MIDTRRNRQTAQLSTVLCGDQRPVNAKTIRASTVQHGSLFSSMEEDNLAGQISLLTNSLQ
jgi:hypothetical protein